MTQLLAQTQESIWPSVVQALSSNGFWVFVAICVLAGTTKHIVQMVLKHRERITMIEMGMRPEKKGDADHETTIHYDKKHGA